MNETLTDQQRQREVEFIDEINLVGGIGAAEATAAIARLSPGLLEDSVCVVDEPPPPPPPEPAPPEPGSQAWKDAQWKEFFRRESERVAAVEKSWVERDEKIFSALPPASAKIEAEAMMSLGKWTQEQATAALEENSVWQEIDPDPSDVFQILDAPEILDFCRDLAGAGRIEMRRRINEALVECKLSRSEWRALMRGEGFLPEAQDEATLQAGDEQQSK